MRLFYSNDFTGHWPVGSSAVVVAEDEVAAREALAAEVAAHGLVFDGTLIELPIDTPRAVVLQDGEY